MIIDLVVKSKTRYTDFGFWRLDCGFWVSDIPEKFDLKEDMTGLSKKIEFIRLSDILDSPLSVISYQLSVISSTFHAKVSRSETLA